MNTWGYLGIAFLVSCCVVLVLTAVSMQGGARRRLDKLQLLPRWARAQRAAATARGGADAVDIVSQSGSYPPPKVSEPRKDRGRRAKASVRPFSELGS